MRRTLALTSLVALPALASAPFVGEWMLDDELCADSRLYWTADGRHGAITLEDGSWQTLIDTGFTREGDVITYSAQGVTERVRITMDGANRLTLENLDREAPNTVVYVRCPQRE